MRQLEESTASKECSRLNMAGKFDLAMREKMERMREEEKERRGPRGRSRKRDLREETDG